MDTNRLYRLVLDAVKDPLVLARSNGAIVLTNAAADAFFDFGSVHNVTALSCDDHDFDIDGVRIVEMMAQHQSVRDFATGTAPGASLSIESVQPEGGEELKLLHFRKPSASIDREFWRDEMIAMVSHEIKNPLSAMKQSVDILLSGAPGELTEGQRRFLGTSGRSIERLTHLVDGFLDVSRIREGAYGLDRRHVDMRNFVAETVRSFRTLFNVRHVAMDWRVEDAAAEAHIDAGKLEQVMINLLNNALKHTPEGGSIRIAVETAGVEAVDDELRLLPWRDLGAPRLLRIRVEDTGLGMSTETLDRVFDRHQGQPGDGARPGHHLGLNISRALIEAQGGHIDIESQLGIGTVVTVHLPQNPATACLLTRMGQARHMVDRFRRARRRTAVLVLGKLTGDNWDDIARSWPTAAVVNPEPGSRPGAPLRLWAINSSLAIAVVAGSRLDTSTLFGERFVECQDDSFIFNGFAAGVDYADGDGRGFSQVCNVAMQRMIAARGVMSRAVDERSDADMAYVLNEWARRPQPQQE